VLGQVDRKFVACVLALGRGRSALVLVDQHAAHERVRVERLLAPACAAFLTGASARVRALAPPVPVLLAAAEARALAENGPRAALARWGVTLDEQSVREAVCRAGSDDAHVQVHVCTVPETVADKVDAEHPRVRMLG
jgi:DNA mismatch repair ATPase MutL